MKKSRFAAMAAVVMLLAMVALPFGAVSHQSAASYPTATASAGAQDTAAPAVNLAAVQTPQAARDINPIYLGSTGFASTECRTCRTATLHGEGDGFGLRAPAQRTGIGLVRRT